MQDLKILALQTTLIWEDPLENRIRLQKKISDSFDDHDLIILPETFTTGFPVDPHNHSESIDGETFSWMLGLASKLNCVITGSLLLARDNYYANTLIWMQPDGTWQAYEKRHVFTMGGEHEKISPGNQKLVVELKCWKIRPMICYDLRFPVWSKNIYNDGFEYDLAIYVANWPAVRSYPWKTLLHARAIENQSYVIGVNRVGKDGPGNSYSGDSMVVDPLGKVILSGKEGEDMPLSATLSYDKLVSFRKSFNVGLDWDRFSIES